MVSAAVRLATFNIPQYARMTMVDEMDFGSLGEKKKAIFCVIPVDDSSMNYLVGMLYTQCFQALYRRADEKHNGRLPVPVRVIQDEWANVAQPESYPKILATCRSYNIGLNIIVQNIQQIKALYEKEWESIIGNCDTLLFLGGGNEPTSLEFIVKLLGKETIATRTRGETKGRSGSSSTNFQQTGRDLMTIDEVRKLDTHKAILFIRGEDPVLDKKYNIKRHPNIKLTTDGKAKPYIERINKLLRCAFGQAVRWDIIAKNPFENTTLPKIKRKPREIWDAATIRKALDECKDGRLYVAINLSFACSLRIGEIVGLTWDNIHISDADIASDNAYLCVEKELVRVREDSLAVLGEEEIIKKFPRTMYLEDASTVIVLKTPKTESSVRKVWMPKTVAYILREWKASQDKQKEFLGSEYLDYNLVVALPNGRPCEETVISNAFRRLKRDAQLPDVVFHSLRHSSTTYKLKLNHGDIKATQGDTGHSQADMVTKVYAHILDEDRKVNAQKFESAFYANPDLRGVQAPAEPAPALDVQSIILQLQQSPELLSALTSLISNQGCK